MSVGNQDDRLPPIPAIQQTPAQKKSTKALISGSRKNLRGPFIALLRSPGLLDRVHPIGEFLRFRSAIPVKLRELAILAVSRHWQQTYEWVEHVHSALDAGLEQTTIDQLALDWDGAGLPDDQRTVLQFVRELQRAHAVDDSLYQQTLELLGENGLVELCGLCGYYTMLAMVMNVARTPILNGAVAPFSLPG
jgi:4-carboxymuconolactone decarboxylase